MFNLKKLLKKQISDVEIHKIIDKKIIENPDGLRNYMKRNYNKIAKETKTSEINCNTEDFEFLKLNTRFCKVYFLKVRDYEKYNELKDLYLNLINNDMHDLQSELSDLFKLFKTKKKVSICDELLSEIKIFTN